MKICFTIFWRRTSAAILIACALPLVAHAAVESFDTSLPLKQTDYSSTLALSQFDPSLGMLQSITITADATAQFSQYYQNLSSSSAGSATVSQSLDMILSQSSLGTLIPDLNVSSGSQTYFAAAYTGTPFFTGPSGGVHSYTDTGSTTVNLNSSQFAPFIGSGMADFLLAANGSGSSSNTTGNFLVGWSTLAGLDLSITYNYLPTIAVPEPATWMSGVFLVTALSAGFARRSLGQRSL